MAHALNQNGPTGLMWFRRDLRLDDNAALCHALQACQQVWCAFVFDTAILDALPRQDRRIDFILAALHDLQLQLQQAVSRTNPQAQASLLVLHGDAASSIPTLAQQLGVQTVWANHDDDPYALARDAAVATTLATQGMALHTLKDHVVFERGELLTQQGKPYSVFTPYKKAWLQAVQPHHLAAYPCHQHVGHLATSHAPADHAAWLQQLQAQVPALCTGLPTLADLGFSASNLSQLKLPLGSQGAQQLWADFVLRMANYADARDFPAIKGPSYLSAHLRFGTISIRQLAREAYKAHLAGHAGASTWLGELIWRDFYHQILAHHPRVVTESFKPAYDAIEWQTGPVAQTMFEAWCQGQTGYPLVDAAMNQLNQTGYMHNRLRMVVASFLTKDLGLDWRWGEQYFAQQLLDFDLAANNGGWQWASSSGCDAQPYFRIFNPITQSERFDPKGRFIQKYVPALANLSAPHIHAPWQASPLILQAAGIKLGENYPLPMVDHAQARQTTLQRYAVVK